MGTLNIRTIGDLFRLGALLLATCRACGHTGRFHAGEMIVFLGAGRWLDDLPLVCSACGSRDVAATADQASLLADRQRSAKPKSLT
jgi:hypothetical protein